jgi:hypothetical protein
MKDRPVKQEIRDFLPPASAPLTKKEFEFGTSRKLDAFWGDQDAVFVDLDLRSDRDTYGGDFRAVVNEEFFIGRGAPSRTEYHFRKLVNREACDCPFCDWFRANLIIE